jgi:hypothetical protein
MRVWSAIRGIWARHDAQLAAHELDREALGVDAPRIADESAFVQEAANLTPSEVRAVEGEGE